MATRKDIAIDCGTTYKMFIQLTDDNDVDIPLQGYKVRSQCRESYNSQETLWNLTNTQGGGITVEDGVITMVVAAGVSSMVQRKDVKRAIYDVEIEAPNGEIMRVAEGKVTFRYEVTQQEEA